MARDIAITSDEINCLVYAYLQDSGFAHAAFALRAEAHLDRTACAAQPVRRGELIDLLAKALLYSEGRGALAGRPRLQRLQCRLLSPLRPCLRPPPTAPPPRAPHRRRQLHSRKTLQNGLKPPVHALNDSLQQAKLDSTPPPPTKPLETGMDVDQIKEDHESRGHPPQNSRHPPAGARNRGISPSHCRPRRAHRLRFLYALGTRPTLDCSLPGAHAPILF